MLWLLGSFSLFHCLLNIMAELTYFGDRLYFKDWWNARDFSDFWRLWNRRLTIFFFGHHLSHSFSHKNTAIHHWLLKYVYWKVLKVFPRSLGMMATFGVSGILHELFMVLVFRKFSIWFFLAMAVRSFLFKFFQHFPLKNFFDIFLQVQVPFITMSQIFKNYKRLGNLMTWLSLFLGQPLLILLYFAGWYKDHQSFLC